jgi:hypothetical protein
MLNVFLCQIIVFGVVKYKRFKVEDFVLREVSQAMDDPCGRKTEAELEETIHSNKMQLTRSTIDPIHLPFLNNMHKF